MSRELCVACPLSRLDQGVFFDIQISVDDTSNAYSVDFMKSCMWQKSNGIAVVLTKFVQKNLCLTFSVDNFG